MAKQTCDKCDHSFSWKEVQNSFMKGYKPITCSSCGEVHYIKDISKLIIGMVVTFPIIFFILLIASALALSPIQTLVIGVLLLAIIISLIPFIAQYESKEKES